MKYKKKNRKIMQHIKDNSRNHAKYIIYFKKIFYTFNYIIFYLLYLEKVFYNVIPNSNSICSKLSR